MGNWIIVIKGETPPLSTFNCESDRKDFITLYNEAVQSFEEAGHCIDYATYIMKPTETNRESCDKER